MIPDQERPDRPASPSSEIPRSGDRPPGTPADEATSRNLAEAASRTLRERLQALIETLPLAIVTVDREQTVQTWNPAAERLFGWKAEEVIGEPVPFVPDDKRQEFRGLLEEPQGAQRDGLEQSFIRKDGSPVNVSLWTVPRLSDTGEVTGSIALFADISERKRAQEALATRTRHLEAVRTVSEEITRELNLPVLLRLIIQRAAELVGASSGVVYQWNESAQELVAGAWYGCEDWAGAIRRKMGDGVAGRVAQHREGLLVNDYQHWPGANPLFRDRSKLTAVLGEPLLYRDQLLGVITLDDQNTGRPFTLQDQETLRLFAAQSAIAIGNARLFQQEQERSNQLDTVRAVTAEVTRELDLSRLLHLITERSVELLGGGSGAVVLWNEAAQVLVPAAWHGHEDWYGATSWRPGEGVLGTVAKRREGLVVNDYRNSPLAHPLFLLRTEITAMLAEPLLYHDRILGVVTVDGYGEGRTFTDQDRRLLSLFASQAAIAIENARLYAAAEQRSMELETLRRIEQAITSRLELPAVLEAVVAGAMRILDNPFAQIILWDGVSQSLRFGAAQGTEAERVKKQQFILGAGINGRVAQTREAMILDDYQASPYAQPVSPDVVATITVPILFGDQLLGVLHSHTTTASRRFTPDDLRRLQVVATQAAYAIENARLHEAAVRRSSEVESLLLSSKAISSSLDLEHVLEAIAQQAAAISATPIVRLFLLEEDAQLLRCRVAVGFPLEEARELVIPVGTSLSGQVAVTGEPLAIADTRGDPRIHYPAHVTMYGVVSYLGLPVKHRDRLFGVLVFNTPTPRVYSRDEIAFLNAFAQQAALAIQNARLYETAVRRGAEREALLRATRSVMAGLDLQEILDRIVAEASRIASAPHVKVLLLDDAAKVLRVGAAKGTATPVGYEFPLGASLSGLVAQTGEPLFQADSPTDQRNILAQTDRDLGIVTYLGLPIKRGDEVLGVLTFNTTVPRQYAAEELAFLAAFADQAAIAIDNARLFQREQKRREQIEAVRAVSEEIARELDPATLFVLITKQAVTLLGAGSGTIFLWDAGTETLIPRGLHGYGDWPADVYLRLGEGVAGTVALRRDGLIVNDYRTSPYAHPEVLERTKITAVLAQPLLYQDRLVGVIAIQDHETGRRFTAQDLDLLRIFASQAAVAIENARLFRDEHDRRVQFEAVRAVSTEITQELNLGKVLQLVAQQACALTGAAAADIDLWDPVRQLLVPEASYGHTTARPRSTRRLGEGAMGTVAKARHGMIINDYRSSPVAHPDTLAHTSITASLVEPLLYRDTLLGVIGVDHESPGRTFSTQDRDLLSLFASQVAIAIENARVHNAAVQRAQQLKTLNEVARTMTQTLDPGRAAQEIVAALQVLIPEAAGQLWEMAEDPEGLRLVTTVSVGEPGEAFRHQVLLGEGLAGIAASSREVVISANVTQDSRFVNRDWAAAEGLVSAIGLPLVHGGRLLGVLIIFTRTAHTFDDPEVDLLGSFAAHAAISSENARLHTAAVRRGAELEALLRATRSIMSGLDVGEILQRIAKVAAAMADVRHVSLLLVDKPAQVLRVAALVGDPVPSGHQIPIGIDLSGHVAQSGEILYSPDSPNDPRNRFAGRDRALGLMTYLGLPVKMRDEVLGVLTFETTTPRRYPPDELMYLSSFATQAAIAIENARLHEAVQRHAAELEARVTERTSELQEALRVKAEFLAKMSHELRTPLNFVLGFADLLQQGMGGELTPKQAQFVERIQSGGKHLLELVSDILDLSVVEAGKGGLQLEPVAMTPIVQEVLDLFGIQVAQKRLELRQEVEPGLSVVAERRKLFQILSNLVANAVKFTSEGGHITVTARRIPAARIADLEIAGDIIEIAVADTGIGLAPGDLERIFRGFEQVDGSATRKHAGAGIGLALVRTLVELHGGKVRAESAGVGQGARFIIHFPILEAPPPKHVLVVEDHAPLLKTLCVFLRDAGYTVEGATTGAGALAASQDRRPDLVVLDIGLPDMDGWQVLRRLRADPRTSRLPVLVLTGLGEAQADQAVALGASEFLTKPVSPSALIGIVRNLLTGGVWHPGHPAPDAEK